MDEEEDPEAQEERESEALVGCAADEREVHGAAARLRWLQRHRVSSRAQRVKLAKESKGEREFVIVALTEERVAREREEFGDVGGAREAGTVGLESCLKQLETVVSGVGRGRKREYEAGYKCTDCLNRQY